MKKIIDGKRYDSEKSELIAEWENPYYRNDFHFCREELYRTKNGNWFIVGEGGGLSKYRQQTGNNSWSSGEGLTPLTEDEAYQWLEEHDFPKTIEEYFPDKIKDA